jgi:hypothetical protein
MNDPLEELREILDEVVIIEHINEEIVQKVKL